MTSTHPDGPEKDADVQEHLWDPIPEITVDKAGIVRRGRRLRTRRRAALSSGALASVALVATVAWTAAFHPLGPVAPAGTGESESGQQASQSTPDPTTPPSDERSEDGPDDDVFSSLMGAADLEVFAAEHSLTAQTSSTEDDLVGVRLTAEDGSTIDVTVTTATAEETTEALQDAVAEGNFEESHIDGLPVYREDRHQEGTLGWRFIAGEEGTELIAVAAAPAGQEPGGDGVPAATVRLVEEDLIPFVIAAAGG